MFNPCKEVSVDRMFVIGMEKKRQNRYESYNSE